MQQTAAPVTRLAFATRAPCRLRQLRLQLKSTLGVQRKGIVIRIALYILLLVVIFSANVHGESDPQSEETLFDMVQLNLCISVAASEGAEWPTRPLLIARQLLVGDPSFCAEVGSSEEAIRESDPSFSTIAFRTADKTKPKITGWYHARFEEKSDGSWRITEIEAVEAVETIQPAWTSSFQSEFDWENKGPLEFLEHLRSRPGTFLVGKVPEDWISEDDLAGLIEKIDSEEPCVAVMYIFSSFSGTPGSTVGNEAAYLIEGFRHGRYPPSIHSKFGSVDKDGIRRWWKKRNDT